MFRAVSLPIIRSLFTVHSAMVCIIQVCRQLSSRSRMALQLPSWSCSKAVYKPVWYIPLLSVQWINCWWWTDELSETCTVSWQNKFVKLVHLVGFVIKWNTFNYILHRIRLGELFLTFISDVFAFELKAYKSTCIIILAILFGRIHKISKSVY